ncbi:hypothetical protein EDB19DRAFT_905494 [Suillus lakei]|nr:hypothetical protein EDB19DRAFT_905494 [Suillus lakei]
MYDYACSIREEGKFLLCSRWSRVKFLYIVTRYVPFLLFAAHLYLNFVPDETSDTCQFVNNICSAFGLISIVCSECFFILRTYVLWNSNNIVLAAMLSTFAAVIVWSTVIVFSATATASFETSSVSGITGCYLSSGSVRFFVPFLLLFGFELVLISLTLTCAVRNWRTTHIGLYVVLLKHNVLYYVCGLFFSTINVLTPLLLNYAYNGFQDFQIIIHVILATRMHLHLWHANRNRNADAFNAFTLPRVAPASHTEAS